MALTVLMFVILILSYALMVGLVQFSENIITRPDAVGADEGDAATAGVAD